MKTRILETFPAVLAVALISSSQTIHADPPAATPAAAAPSAASAPPAAQAPISVPSDAPTGPTKTLERPPLLPEGAFLTQAVGSLEPCDGDRGWQFRFRDSFEGESDRVVQLLPSITLEDMIRNRAQLAPGTVAKFSLTGRVTVYRRNNYVVPLFATVISAFPARQPRPTLAPPGAWYGSNEAVAVTTSRTTQEDLAEKNAAMANVRRAFLSLASPLSPEALAAEQSQKQRLTGGISADDIEQELVARVGDVPRSMDAPRLPPVDPGSPNEMKWLQPGRRVHDRLGTVMRDPVNGVWRFVFESARGRVGEREAVLMPCQMLESIARQAQSNGGLYSGVISGEITLFEGRSYLLPSNFGPLRTGKLLSR